MQVTLALHRYKIHVNSVNCEKTLSVSQPKFSASRKIPAELQPIFDQIKTMVSELNGRYPGYQFAVELVGSSGRRGFSPFRDLDFAIDPTKRSGDRLTMVKVAAFLEEKLAADTYGQAAHSYTGVGRASAIFMSTDNKSYTKYFLSKYTPHKLDVTLSSVPTTLQKPGFSRYEVRGYIHNDIVEEALLRPEEKESISNPLLQLLIEEGLERITFDNLKHHGYHQVDNGWGQPVKTVGKWIAFARWFRLSCILKNLKNPYLFREYVGMAKYKK